MVDNSVKNAKFKKFGSPPLPIEKSLLKSIFGHISFISRQIFKFFAAHVRTNGLLIADKEIIAK